MRTLGQLIDTVDRLPRDAVMRMSRDECGLVVQEMFRRTNPLRCTYLESEWGEYYDWSMRVVAQGTANM